jgi:sulfur-carrier protein adenylyltransferase/sulfurtransferase
MSDEPPLLNKEELSRYSRHITLPEVGLSGQKRLKSARICIVGTGGLGSPTATYLAAAGVGTLGLVDFDTVDATNLHRQLIHTTPDVGRSKVDSATDSIRAINPHVEVVGHETALTSENALEILRDYDIVIDGTDNFPTRYLVNDACVLLGKPNCYGSIFRFEGQASVFATKDGPCYRCLFPEPPPPGSVPNCAEGGVLGVLPGIIGLIQATEAVKLILGLGDSLAGRLLLYDALAMSFRQIGLKKDPRCPVCGNNPTVTELIDYNEFCGAPGASQTSEENGHMEISVTEVKSKLDNDEDFVLIDVREQAEYDMCRIIGSKLIPLSEFEVRMSEIPKDKELVIHCKMGGRSAQAQSALLEQGWENVLNMTGGINAWALEIDTDMPQY